MDLPSHGQPLSNERDSAPLDGRSRLVGGVVVYGGSFYLLIVILLYRNTEQVHMPSIYVDKILKNYQFHIQLVVLKHVTAVP